MVILTGGEPTEGGSDPVALAQATATDAKDNHDITIVGVWIGPNAGQLDSMVSEPVDKNTIRLLINNPGPLHYYIDDLANSICPPSESEFSANETDRHFAEQGGDENASAT
jgi:hypothetical protein